MTIWKRWIQRSVLCGVLLGGVAGCSMVGHPSVGQIAISDHVALATWYDGEAAQLRQKAKDHAELAVAYRKDPSVGTSVRVGHHIVEFGPHCDALAEMYTKAAEEADEISRGHRDMLK